MPCVNRPMTLHYIKRIVIITNVCSCKDLQLVGCSEYINLTP